MEPRIPNAVNEVASRIGDTKTIRRRQRLYSLTELNERISMYRSYRRDCLI